MQAAYDRLSEKRKRDLCDKESPDRGKCVAARHPVGYLHPMLIRSLSLLFTVLMGVTLSAADMPDESNRLQPGHLPTPYSAEDIRDHCRPGYTTIYKIEAEGVDPFLRVSSFLDSGSEKARFDGHEESMNGEVLREYPVSDADWKTLQGHASFPVERTDIGEDTITIPAGTFQCWKYVLKSGPSNDSPIPRPERTTFWFAKNLPGPPVKMVQETKGKATMTMTLVKYGVE